MEKYYLEEERNIEILEEADVLVVGGGSAGSAAAIAAARAVQDCAFGEIWTTGRNAYRRRSDLNPIHECRKNHYDSRYHAGNHGTSYSPWRRLRT